MRYRVYGVAVDFLTDWPVAPVVDRCCDKCVVLFVCQKTLTSGAMGCRVDSF